MIIIDPVKAAKILNPVPISITPKQTRLALLQAGILDTVEGLIAGMEGSEGQAARIIWEWASDIRRDDALLLSLTATLGMTSEQIDQLFITAATL